jgi:signal transduction histidine kinase
LEELVVVRTAEIEQRRQIAEGLREILILLNSNRTLEESLHYIVSQAARLTEAEDVIIFHQSDDQPLTIMATNPGGQIRYSAGTALRSIISNWAQEGLTLREPLIIPDLMIHWLKLSDRGPARLANHKALLGIPLLVGDEVYGGLVMFYEKERSFEEEDLDLGFTFADQAALAIANAYLREQAEETAVATERSRLARELHDAVTQTIFSASLIAETVSPIWESDPDQGRLLLGELRKLTRGALAEMRTLLLELRPASLEEAQLSDLINQLAEALSGRSGVPVSTEVTEVYDIPVNVKVALYRIAQESLNNVMKHARATKVEVCLARSPQDSGLILTVKDNGRGFDLDSIPADRLGVSIMRERAQGIGATLAIESRPDQGTKIEVLWERNI